MFSDLPLYMYFVILLATKILGILYHLIAFYTGFSWKEQFSISKGSEEFAEAEIWSNFFFLFLK